MDSTSSLEQAVGLLKELVTIIQQTYTHSNNGINIGDTNEVNNQLEELMSDSMAKFEGVVQIIREKFGEEQEIAKIVDSLQTVLNHTC